MKSQHPHYAAADVLDQSEIEQADRLIATNERFPFIFDGRLETVVIVDLEGDRVYATGSAGRTSLSPTSPDFKGSYEAVHSECRRILTQAVRETIRSGADQRVEFPVRSASGEVRTIGSQTSIVWNEQGKVSKIVIVSHDLKESQTFLAGFRSIVDAMNDWLWEIDAQHKFMYTSPQVKRLLGYEPQELLGRKMEDLTVPDDAVQALAMMEQAMRDRRSVVGIEARHVHKDGHIVVLETTATPIVDNRGVLRGYRGIGRDITQRKIAEEQLRKLSRAVEQSPATIVITDTAGNIEYVNPKFCEVTGYTYDEAIGQNPRLLKSGEMPREEYRRMWETISSGGEWRGEFHNRKKNGELYWEFASVSPIRDAAGTITHYLAVKEDVTARKRTDEERIKLVSELQRALAKVKTLSGLLPICAWCKRVRDDEGYWKQIESYVEAHSDAEFTHGICPECAEKHRQTMKTGKELE